MSTITFEVDAPNQEGVEVPPGTIICALIAPSGTNFSESAAGAVRRLVGTEGVVGTACRDEWIYLFVTPNPENLKALEQLLRDVAEELNSHLEEILGSAP